MQSKHPKLSLDLIQEKVNGNICPNHNMPPTITMDSRSGKLTINACCKEFRNTIQNLCDQVKIEFYKDQHKKLNR